MIILVLSATHLSLLYIFNIIDNIIYTISTCIIRSGGFAASGNFRADQDNILDEQVDQFNVIQSGYGFACFIFLLGFFIAVSGSIYLSPPLMGSDNEKAIIKDPMNLPTSA